MSENAATTDHIDLASVLKLELGLPIEAGPRSLRVAVATPETVGDLLTRFEALPLDDASQAVVWMLDRAHDVREAPRLLVMTRSGDIVNLRMGFTVWAGRTPGSPLLVVSPNGSEAHSASTTRLLDMPRVPLAGEASIRPGVVRAIERLTSRLEAAFERDRAMTRAA